MGQPNPWTTLVVTLTGGRCPEAPRSSATLQQNCQRRPTAYTTRIAGHFNQRRRPQHAPGRQNGQSACVCTRRYRCRKSRAGEQKRILQRAYTIRSDVQARSVGSRRRIRRFNARRSGGTPFLIGRRGYHRSFVAGTSPPQSE